MNQKSKFHQFISLAVSLGLLLQLIMPIGAIVAQPLVQDPIPTTDTTEGETITETAVPPSISTTNQPAALSPLTLSKAQSTFQAGGTAVITYTVRNTLGPTLRPDADASDTITDTIAAINATDFAADPNNIRDAQLTLQLTNGQTTLQSSSLPVDQDGDIFSFNLGDIPPLSAAELVLELTVPSSAADFMELDTGVVGNGRYRSIPVSAATAPIRLAPDGFAQWLTCTPDANCADSYVIRKAAELNNDPTAIFEFVRSLGYESYEGSLRGSRGTLWSEAGNGYDQASLLIALLRASGIPAAYRLGTLDQAAAQTLISSMFPAVNAPSGLVPAGTATADPINDPTLIAETQDHAWAEAYFPGSGWTILDAAFASAQPGDTFGSASGGQLVELPDNTRHKVTVSLEVEKYSQFPVGGTNLYRVNPLTTTFSTVALAGEPLVFAHLVDSTLQGGLAFTSAEHTYTPYFVFGEAQTLVEGDPFGELISNFPFGQDLVVAEWLDFTVISPSGSSETFRRELFDDIGYEVRAGNGLISDMARDETARLSLMSSWTTLIAAYAVPEEAINDAYQEMVALTLAGIETREATAGLQDTPNPTPEQSELAKEAVITYGNIARLAQRMHLLKFAAASDQSHDTIGDAFLVKAYPDSPRLFTVGWERNEQEETDSISFDLLHNKIRAIAYPGQTDIGTEAFLFWRGLLDMAIEHEILDEVSPAPTISVGAVFDQAIADDIALERITFGTLDELAALPISEQAKARITTVLTENTNSYVMVPAEMVTMAGAPEPTIGWLEIDNETLAVIDTMENGQHMAVEYAALAKFSQKAGSFIGGFTAGFFGHTMGFWIGFFEQMPLGDQDIEAVIASSKQTAAEWGKKAEDACVKKSDEKWCKRGVAAGNAVGSAILAKSDPPLQEMLFVLPLDAPVVNEETAVSLTQAASLSGSSINTTLATNLVAVTGSSAHSWTTGGQNSFLFDSLSVGSADVYQNGNLVASGSVTAVPTIPSSPASAQTDNSAITISGSTDGTISLYAPALSDLGGGSQLDSYNLNLNAANYILALTDATVTVNGNSYSGNNLEIRTSSPSQVSGTGATAVPNFATNASFTPNSGGFMVADGSGSLTVGGSAVSAANGFALANSNSQGSIAPAGATDTFSYSGNADFFALDLSSDASTIPADTAASFDADIEANFTGSYTLTAHVASGWDVSATTAGLITAQPPVGATAGAYSILVTAQSKTYPDLFVSAEHVVTLTAVAGVSVSVAPDPVFTIPWGPATDVVNFDTAVGRFQIPNAAFAATIQNTSSETHTFDVDVSGLPFGWTIFGGTAGSDTMQLSLVAGEMVQLGLYISPTTSLPSSGNTYPFNITATALDNGSITAVGNETFTMPALAYPAVTVNPTTLYAAANSEATFDVTVTNIGNTSGSFDLLSTVPVNDWSVSNLQSPISLSPGASNTQLVTVTLTTGDPGIDYPVGIGSSVPTLPYTPTTAVDVYIVSALTKPIYQAASCTLESEALEAAIISLAGAVGQLENSCSSGSCDLGQRDAVVVAMRSVTTYARAASSLVTSHSALNALADTLASHSDDVDIEADLVALTPAITDLGNELCQIEQYAPAARFTPYVDAILLGDSANFSLDVSNEGTLATTYAITVTGLPSGDLTFNELIQPGATTSLPITPTPAALGVFDLTATVVPAVPGETITLAATAVARLNVVDKFVQVTQVLPDPPFVETGISSSTISAEIANVSGVGQAANARTAVLAPNGSSLWTTDTPMTVLAGNPRLYELGTVDTSGWAAGVYTVTVDLLDGSDALIPDGFGYGYLSVGQGLEASHAVWPELVAPGDVTVTLGVTTTIEVDPIGIDPLRPVSAAPIRHESNLPALPATAQDLAYTDSLLYGPNPADWLVEAALPEADTELVEVPLSPPVITATETITDGEQPSDDALQSPISNPAAPLAISATFTRTEQSDPSIVYTGTWPTYNNDRTSSGYARADSPGETAVFTFSGDWINVGFLGDRFSGQAELFIDGVSQGILDLYRRDDTAISFVYDGLINSSHIISITALGTSNPYAINDYVQLDYFDVWNSSALPDGTFEQDDPRVIVSNGWFNQNDAIASGGSYIRDNIGTVWFPFSGDSFSYHAILRNNAKHTRLYVDGNYLTDLNLFSYDTITRTFSFEGFGTGPHILQVSAYRDDATVDAFTTPGIAPFDDPDPLTSYQRYEEDHPNWLYSGSPFTQTTPNWARLEILLADNASDDQVVWSDDAGETAVISVTGEWINLGLGTGPAGGHADIYLDGVLDRTVDLYRRQNGVTSEFFPALTNSAHTISVTVAGDGDVWIDYVDVWDGTTLPDGTFETVPNERLYLSGNWSRVNSTSAVNGNYLRNNTGTAWLPFTGDSVSYRAFAYSGGGDARLYLDDQFVGTLDLFNGSNISRTFSFDGLGAGIHLLRLEQHYGNLTLEDFTTPGAAPFYNPTPDTGVIRYEEDDPALLYNGVPLTQTTTSWILPNTAARRASAGYYAYSNTAGDAVSLAFNGTWAGVGLLTWRDGGLADIYIDGVLQQTVDLYTISEDTRSIYFDNLLPGAHTISVTVRGESHLHAVNTYVMVDFIDVWDGTVEPDGTFEETDRDRLIFSPSWNLVSEPEASGGSFARDTNDDSTVWFPFTGDSVTFRPWANRSSHELRIHIDGQPMGADGIFDIFADAAISPTLSFDGLGAGPHVMEISGYRYDTTIDNFTTPGVPPFYQAPPPPTGIIRYEEDDPALRYNGYPYEQTEYCFLSCWVMGNDASTSNAYIAQTRRPGDWVEMDFYGSWVGIGFDTGTYDGVAEVFIDGSSVITVDLGIGQDVKSIYFTDLITDNHTISATLLSGRMRVDFFDAWDGSAMGDGWFDADLDDHRGAFHYSNLSSWVTDIPTQFPNERLAFARNQDAVSRGSISSNTHMWFGFTGNDLLFLPFQKDGKSVELFIDGLSQGVIDLTPEFSTQPKAFYITDLGDGPHMVHLNAADDPFIDAFMVNPPNLLPYTPIVEWHDDAPTDVYTDTFSNSGLLSTAAIGDLQGDGVVEIVVPSSNGQMYVYRGDGQDTGDGDPILWQTDLVGAAAEPTLVDLDGDSQAEIIVMGSKGTAAFHADGSLYWFTDTIKSTIENAGWGGSSVGNIDLEPGPEIVLAAHNDALYVLDHDGTLLYSEPTGSLPSIPTLADLTGDGVLDIVFAQDKTITVYDAFNGFNIAWTRTHTYTGGYGQAFGSPAVIDVDGKQPGGDDGPEVVINWGHYIDVLDDDGSLLWNFYTGEDSFRRPSPITVADVDGDNEIELLTASAKQSGFLVFYHRLFVINADGTLLWSQDMGDTTASASGVATQDLNGDGVWEVIWNGYNEGFTILNGPSGEKLFNEEVTESGTFVDYPALGDVDGDGYAEVVTGGKEGLYVIGHDEIWGDSRPLWNQHNYHVTNINDDWSVPISEANNWDVHNTYRTQTPERNPAPTYRVAITHTAVLTNTTLLTQTATRPLTELPPDYAWEYVQEWTSPVMTTTVDNLLSGMQPGEVRQISEGTHIAYQLPSGINNLVLPPLYVTAAHLGELAPLAQSIPAGGTAVFSLTLTNPATNADTLGVAVSGVPVEWLSYPASVPLNAGETVIVLITIAVPSGAETDVLPLFVDVSNSGGGVDNLQATLTVFAGLDLTIAPASQTAFPDVPTAYTLTLTNLEPVSHTYSLTSSGLITLDLPGSVVVAGNSAETAVFTATATSPDPYAFTIEASAPSGAAASADAVLEILAVAQADLMLAPDPAVAGPLSTAVLTLTVTNLSSLAETFDLQVTVPTDWSYELVDNSGSVSSVSLPPTVFNSAELMLRVTPDAAVVVGDYDVEVTAVAQSSGATAGAATSTVEVINQGVHVEFTSGPASLDPRDPATWNVQVTNTGNVADTFDLEAGGIMALAGSLSPNMVTLAAGASQTVQLSVDGLDSVLPQTYLVNVAATSQTDTRIAADDTTSVDLTGFEAVQVGWQPAAQTVTDTLTAQFTLLITNTGNVSTVYDVETAVPGATSILPDNQLLIPAHSAMQVVVTVNAPDAGVYTLSGTADSTSSSATDSAPATLTIVITNQAPVVDAGQGQTVNEGTAVAFNGIASDPDNDPFSILWHFGDGGTATGSLTPSHTFGDNGVYNVTLTVTDTGSLASTDNVLITVNNVAPSVNAGSDLTGSLNAAIQFNGSFTDPGTLDTHTIVWDFGDSTMQSGSLTPNHSYTASGEYIVTLTVTDDDGGVDSDTLLVLVEYQVLLPVILKP